MTTTKDDPDQIRREIERTRQNLSSDVEALTEKVNPSRVVERKLHRVRGAMARAKDKVMGSTEDSAVAASQAKNAAVSTASDALNSAGERIGDVPQTVQRKTQGNPIAAGLIAFGAGWLVSSLLPPTRKEQEFASRATDLAKEQAKPLAQQLGQAASEVGENLREPAQQAVDSVKETATEAASTVADEGRSAGEQVGGRAQQAADTVQDGPAR